MQRHFENRSHPLAASRYLERLSKALPGKGWSRSGRDHWPDGAKLVIAISLQFESGVQPRREASSPFKGNQYSETALTKWWDYGFKEGIPRLLDIFRRRHVRVTSHMAGEAVERNPEVAHEIVERGHEAGLRGRSWSVDYALSNEEERRSYEADLHKIQQATAVRPIGFHSAGLRSSPETVETLQDLGFLYHVDDVSRDEPFAVVLKGKPFISVPYSIGLNDLVGYETRNFTSDQFASELKNEFEMLYSESESRRRMLSISVHDRITGRPRHAKVLEEFIIYSQRRPGVVYMRQDDIARFAASSSSTPREEEVKRGREAA